MKPKIKSNASLMTLLFFFSLHASAMNLTSDTIILDGERIEIERSPERLNLDSLQDSFHKSHEKWGLMVMPYANVSLTHGHLAYIDEGAVFLNDFVGGKDSWTLGPGFGVLVEKKLDRNFAVSLAFSWNSCSIKSNNIIKSDLSAVETYKFESFEQGEFSQIINTFIDPGYELDTLLIPAHEENFSFQSRDIVARAKVLIGDQKKNFGGYMHFGPFYRSIHWSHIPPMTVIAGTDSLVNWDPSTLELRTSQWGGTLGGGMNFHLNRSSAISWGMDIWIPAGVVSTRPDITFIDHHLSLYVGYAKFF